MTGVVLSPPVTVAAYPTESRGYLAGQRRMIIARSIAGSLTGALPVPFLDDRARTAVVGGGYRRIAAAYRIELHQVAQRTLVHGAADPPSLTELAGGEIAYRIASPAARWGMLAFAAVMGAQSASRTFVTMTLFDHYCARLHTGGAIGAAIGRALREEIDRAIDLVPGGLELLPPRGAVERNGLLSSMVAAIELRLSVEANPFLDRAIDVLDRGWRVRVLAGIR